MDDRALINSYCSPNVHSDPKDGYYPVERLSELEKIEQPDGEAPGRGRPAEAGIKEVFYRVWRERGLKEADIDKRFAEWGRSLGRG